MNRGSGGFGFHGQPAGENRPLDRVVFPFPILWCWGWDSGPEGPISVEAGLGSVAKDKPASTGNPLVSLLTKSASLSTP